MYITTIRSSLTVWFESDRLQVHNTQKKAFNNSLGV